jgi:opacity protein-like surface antigen
MKKLVLAAALATLVATPALAQYQYSAAPRHGGSIDRLAGIRAQALPSTGGDNVFVNGAYAGSDPDANVRLQLQRDYPDNH